MDDHRIHFEVFARRSGGSGYGLESATEHRERALEIAEELLDSARFTSVRVTKETQDSETGEFISVTILNKGSPDKPRSKVAPMEQAPLCVSPADLYTMHARDRIGRLLQDWLNRQKATPFELLHRADLIEKLDASGVELQHAIQKIAVPEAQATGVGVHEIIRRFQGLIQRAIDRVLGDARKGLFPTVTPADYAAACERLADNPERFYLLGGGVAAYVGDARTWSDKVGRLLDLADGAPIFGSTRPLALQVIEQPLGEILGSRMGLAEFLGPDLDFGASVGALTRLAASETVKAVSNADATVARLIPPLSGVGERLGHWLSGPSFEGVRLALCQRILQELAARRRLRPSDARGEIEVLRALAMCLTAAAGKLLPLEDVREAFVERSKMLVASEFVEAYLRGARSAVQEALDLIWLLENVTGGGNKRQAIRWLLATVSSLRFESEALASTASSPSARLLHIAEIYRETVRAGGDVAGTSEVLQRLADLGGRIEAENKIVSLLAKSAASPMQKLAALLKMASGESAPPGPATERAKVWALKLAGDPGLRSTLSEDAEVMRRLRQVIGPLAPAA
ncbi:MAG TPA: hypothetical protein VIJ94_14280 [Caulobacteraceae bacterium]